MGRDSCTARSTLLRARAQVREHTGGGNKIPLTGVVAAAVAMRSCRRVSTYGLSTMTAARSTCFYFFRCAGRERSDAQYHSRPGDGEFHDFRGNAAALLKWNASGHLRIRA